MEKLEFDFWFKRHYPNIPFSAAQETLKFLAAGYTAPYVFYYQRDKVEGINLAQIYEIIDADAEWKELRHRQDHIFQEISAQNKMTDELKELIYKSYDLDRLEDLYVPFKLKRQTLGVQAREAGLGKLADYIWKVGHGETPAEEIPGATLEEKASSFVQAEGKYSTAELVLKGVSDILVEQIAESTKLRSLVRGTVLRRSKIKSSKGTKAKKNSRYTKYFDYQEPVGSLKKTSSSYRYLTIRRGWMEDELVLSFERPDEGVLLEQFEEFACTHKESIGAELLVKAARLALKGNVYTVMENEAHRYLKEMAEKNVSQSLAEAFFKKLMRAPLGKKAVMGVDAGTEANKIILVLINEAGKYLLHTQFDTSEILSETVKNDILKMIENTKVQALALAHGPQSKEYREIFRKLLEGREVPIVNVHEHTSSIYASSGASKEEFPSFELPVKRAIFVARYLQDPMQTLLRLDTKYIYLHEIQHEITGAKLKQALLRAAEAAIAKVGLEVNFVQSPHVLAKVPGLNLDIAKKIFEAKEKIPFTTRESLKTIPELNGEKFTSVAPFFKTENGGLDASAIHPDWYETVKTWCSAKGYPVTGLNSEQAKEMLADETLKTQLGAFALELVSQDLEFFGQDPRGSFVTNNFSPDLKSLADLKKDAEYPGVITNVTAFGAFVDIGLEQDGLIHISEFSHGSDILEMLTPGDRVSVWLVNLNEEKKQISLTLKSPQERARSERPRRGRGDHARGERRPPRRRPDAQAAAGGAEASPDGAPAGDGQQGTRRPQGGRDRFEKRFNNRRPRREEPPKELDPKAAEIAAIKAKKLLPRDPKTGAIVKLDDVMGGGGRGGPGRGGPRGPRQDGPRVPSKAKPHTFNPFANLGDLLKDKSKQ